MKHRVLEFFSFAFLLVVCRAQSAEATGEWPALKAGTSVEIWGSVNFPTQLRKELRKADNESLCNDGGEAKDWGNYDAYFYNPDTGHQYQSRHLFIKVACGSDVVWSWIFELYDDKIEQLSFAYGSFDPHDTLIGFHSESSFQGALIDPITGTMKTYEQTHTCDNADGCDDHEHIYELHGPSYNLVGINLINSDRGLQKVLYDIKKK